MTRSSGAILGNQLGAVTQGAPGQLAPDPFRQGSRHIHVGGPSGLLQDVLQLGLQGSTTGSGLGLEQFQGPIIQVANEDIWHGDLQLRG
jgi:hypothetical protein